MDRLKKSLFLFLVFALGLATLVLEITGARLISPFFGSTIFVWSSLLSATLGGLALGYIIGAKVSQKYLSEKTIFFFLVIILGLFLLLTPWAVRPISEFMEQFGLRFGPLLSALVLFFPSFAVVGATTPLSVKIYSETRPAGSAAGRLYALGTVGSLLGALLVGFFLIPVMSLSTILLITAILLLVPGILAFFIAGEKINNKILAGMLLFFFLSSGSLSVINAQTKNTGTWAKIIDRATTFYTGIKVIEFGDLRCILGGLKLYSCINKTTGLASDDFNIIKDGINPFVESLRSGDSALLLGGGSGMALEKLPAGVSGTMVELDPQITAFAEKYFGLDSKSREIITDDARHAVKNFIMNEREFNLVIMDVIENTTIPPYIMSKEAFSELSRILKPGGLLIIHGGISTEKPDQNDPYLGAILKTAENEFPVAKIAWRNDSNSRNIVLYFSKNQIPPLMMPEIKINPSSRELTDDFNPLDYYDLDRQLKLTGELRNAFSGIVLR